MDLNSDLVRWFVVIVTAPWWSRLLRMLWQDFNGALREEGGLLGSPPPPSEIEEIRRQKAAQPDLLVSEPWARPQDRRHPRLKSPAPARAGDRPAGRTGAAPAPGRTRGSPRGFR